MNDAQKIEAKKLDLISRLLTILEGGEPTPKVSYPSRKFAAPQRSSSAHRFPKNVAKDWNKLSAERVSALQGLCHRKGSIDSFLVSKSLKVSRTTANTILHFAKAEGIIIRTKRGWYTLPADPRV